MSRWCDENTETNQDVIMIEKKEIQVSHVILKTSLYNYYMHESELIVGKMISSVPARLLRL